MDVNDPERNIDFRDMESVKEAIQNINGVYGLKHIDDATPRPAPTGFEGNHVDDAIRDLITQYHSLNPSQVTELQEDPSPLEFMRHVASNRPFVIRGGASSWAARKKWSADYFDEMLRQGTPVQLASTPSGNADSVLPVDSTGEKMIFVKPHETTEPFYFAMRLIQDQEKRHREGNPLPTEMFPIRYIQTQNDNLRNECAALASDVPNDIPFARIALQKSPDAVNFWLGNSLSTTALHKDNYENIYAQILGKKHFVLLPPVEAPCVNERSLLSATYGPNIIDASEGKVSPRIDQPVSYTPFPTWDPDEPGKNATAYSELSRPLRVTLNEGDVLYLPALWYHKVGQTCNEEGLCCAVNYWYDMEFGGGFWSMANFVRGVGLVGQGEGDEGVNGR